MERPASNFLSPRWPDPNLFFSRLLICLLFRLNVPQTSLAFPPWDFYYEFPFPYTKTNNVQINPISTPININPIPALSIRPNTHTAFSPQKSEREKNMKGSHLHGKRSEALFIFILRRYRVFFENQGRLTF